MTAQPEYKGWLTPHLPYIMELQRQGLSLFAIEQRLEDEGIRSPYYREHDPPRPGSVAGLIGYALSRQGLRAKPVPSEDRWTNLVPDDVAFKQRRWERQQMVLRARRAGLTYYEIGSRFGVGVERARQITLRAMRESDWRSPVEKYLEHPLMDLRDQTAASAALAVAHSILNPRHFLPLA